jgi:hypothetical protein
MYSTGGEELDLDTEIENLQGVRKHWLRYWKEFVVTDEGIEILMKRKIKYFKTIL